MRQPKPKHTLKSSIYAEIVEARMMLSGARDCVKRDELDTAKSAIVLALEACWRAKDAIVEREEG
jgi:hypothetical protein